ncbi:hypothetical protein [Microbacterium sp. 22296]|uniref:hypothetical protein n=1 Tax=Microbacterium sp. 22296 TaxID=3453903 RepID=UPI003F8567D0
MTRHVLGVVLAQGLELVPRCAREIPRGDFLGDLRSTLSPVLGRAGGARVLSVEATGSSGSGATVAGRTTVVTGVSAGLAFAAGTTGAPGVVAERTITRTRRARVVVATERTIPVPRRTTGTRTVTTGGTISLAWWTRIVVATERTIPIPRRTTGTRTVTTGGTISLAWRTRIVVATERTIPVPRRATGTRTVATGGTISLAWRTRIVVATEQTIPIPRRASCAVAVASSRPSVARRCGSPVVLTLVGTITVTLRAPRLRTGRTRVAVAADRAIAVTSWSPFASRPEASALRRPPAIGRAPSRALLIAPAVVRIVHGHDCLLGRLCP